MSSRSAPRRSQRLSRPAAPYAPRFPASLSHAASETSVAMSGTSPKASRGKATANIGTERTRAAKAE